MTLTGVQQGCSNTGVSERHVLQYDLQRDNLNPGFVTTSNDSVTTAQVLCSGPVSVTACRSFMFYRRPTGYP